MKSLVCKESAVHSNIIRNPTISFTKKFKLKYSSKVYDVTFLIFQERDTYRQKTTNVKKNILITLYKLLHKN